MLPIVAMFVFGVHQLINAGPFIYFFFPRSFLPSFCIALQHINLFNKGPT